MGKMVIRALTTMEELRQIQVVEEAVWHMPPIPIHQTFTALNNGGIIFGAFDGDEMVGFLYSFAGYDGGEAYLCSHMLGILPAYRTDGLGVRMKWKQAELARKMGYHMITWTFDPLESLNAYLNLHKLSAKGVLYKANHYGSMNDEFNQGLPSDRIQIRWDIGKSESDHAAIFNERNVLLTYNPEGHPLITERFYSYNKCENDTLFVAIPARFQELKQRDFELAKKWRMETRKVFQSLFAHGYHASNVIRDHTNQLSYYVFIAG